MHMLRFHVPMTLPTPTGEGFSQMQTAKAAIMRATCEVSARLPGESQDTSKVAPYILSHIRRGRPLWTANQYSLCPTLPASYRP